MGKRRDPFQPSLDELRQMKQLGGWLINGWNVLAGSKAGHRAIIVGNGPSRGYLDNRGEDLIAELHCHKGKGTVLIGTNTQWDEPFASLIDLYVCYDLSQIYQAIKNTDRPVFAPEHRVYTTPPIRPNISKLSLKTQERNQRRLYCITPHTAQLNDKEREAWNSPLDTSLGNYSGLLAYQLAWILGCSEIFLVGSTARLSP